MIGDVLDLVRNRSGVGLAEIRQRVRQRLARHVHAQDGRGDPRLQLRRQLRDQALGFERGIPGRLGSERVEMRGQMAVHAVGLDERHRRRDAAE